MTLACQTPADAKHTYTLISKPKPCCVCSHP
jgi:hypothetical protein